VVHLLLSSRRSASSRNRRAALRRQLSGQLSSVRVLLHGRQPFWHQRAQLLAQRCLPGILLFFWLPCCGMAAVLLPGLNRCFCAGGLACAHDTHQVPASVKVPVLQYMLTCSLPDMQSLSKASAAVS
jgi:hypothetical protein